MTYPSLVYLFISLSAASEYNSRLLELRVKNKIELVKQTKVAKGIFIKFTQHPLLLLTISVSKQNGSKHTRTHRHTHTHTHRALRWEKGGVAQVVEAQKYASNKFMGKRNAHKPMQEDQQQLGVQRPHVTCRRGKIKSNKNSMQMYE